MEKKSYLLITGASSGIGREIREAETVEGIKKLIENKKT